MYGPKLKQHSPTGGIANAVTSVSPGSQHTSVSKIEMLPIKIINYVIGIVRVSKKKIAISMGKKHIMSDCVFLEYIDTNIGPDIKQVLVTDLNNHSFPIIREG